jgi:3-keto-disaccharide hydrolase
MNRLILALMLLASLHFQCSGAGYYDISDPVMGEYDGFWTSANGARGRVTAQIRPLSNNQYGGFVLLKRARSPVGAFNLNPAVLENGTLRFTSIPPVKEAGGDLMAKSEANCSLEAGKLTGRFSGELGEGSFEASKAERKSPTLGAKPSKNAVVLFDGKAAGWDQMPWPVTPDGAIQVSAGNARAKAKITNYRLHLEFRTPYMPAALGQERGNSGVYLQGKYEVQVLDSFGLYPLQDNDCGGIYRVHAPQLNACLPPGEWQTYDITYVEANAAKNRPAFVTVIQNGVTVIDHIPIPATIAANGTGGGDPQSGFLMLQNHGNPVQFRNIWAEPFFATERKR